MSSSLTSADLASVSIGTRVRRRVYLRHFAGHTAKRVLECGSGAGAYSGFLKSMSDAVVAFDLRPSLVRGAKERVRDVDFLVADILQIPCRDSVFDLVVAADVIEHTSDAERAVSEIARVARPGGLMAITVPAAEWQFVCRALRRPKHFFGHNYLFEDNLLLSMLDSSGFDVICHKRVCGFLTALLDGVTAVATARLYGDEVVVGSQMSTATAKSRLLSVLYYWGSKVLYPVFLLADLLTPQRWRLEHFVVAKKR
jgi:SAM-dependent methyltransferase